MSHSLDELSQGMDPEEKKLLLGKIQASLNLSAKDTDSIISKAEAPEELKHRLSKEVKKLGFLDRFFVKISAFFGNRSEYEILADRKLSTPRLVLRERVPDLITFSKGEWSPEFAKRLYDLYVEVQNLRPVFEHLFHQKLTLEAGMLLLIREEHAKSIKGLEDILSDEEIGSLYKVEQKRSILQSQLDQRLEKALAATPQAVFDRVRDRLRTLYFARPLVQYPFDFLFDLFGHVLGKADINKYPYFQGVPWRKAAGLLERLYYGIHLLNKIDWRSGSLDSLFEGLAERLSNEKTTWTLEMINDRMAGLVRSSHDLSLKLPWKEILQWSFQDPYYAVKYVVPQFSVREFYQTTLSMNLKEELDLRIPQIRERLLEEERNILFRDGTFHPLEFYLPGAGMSLGGNQKVPGFQYPETLGLLWGFMSYYFLKKIVPFHQSLSRMVAPGSKNTIQALSSAVDELASLRTKIHQFDHSLHPDAPEGKEFQKLRYEMASKPLSLKAFLQLVQNKDSQAMEYIERGIDALETLHLHLSGLRDRNVPALTAILKFPYLLEGQQETIENGLDRLLIIVQKTIFVLREAQNLEI